MPRIEIETLINATPEQCFDLMRDPRINSAMSVDSDVTVPLLGQKVTFESSFLGVAQSLVVLAVEVERPRRLVDAMVDGVFEAFFHVHEFEVQNGKTLLRDILMWDMAYGTLGRFADKLVVERRLRQTVEERNMRLKALVESE
jgi:ligand-binding SRPBCC domain-containing protein